MRRALVAICLAFASVTRAEGQARTRSGLDRFDEARASIQQWMEREAVPGLAIAVTRGDSILWEEGFGWANREARTPRPPRRHSTSRLGPCWSSRSRQVSMPRTPPIRIGAWTSFSSDATRAGRHRDDSDYGSIGSAGPCQLLGGTAQEPLELSLERAARPDLAQPPGLAPSISAVPLPGQPLGTSPSTTRAPQRMSAASSGPWKKR